MEIYQIYIDFIYNPLSLKNLRRLEEYYRKNNMLNEANAFGKLITIKNDNNTNSSQK
jgi:hypothetical protein